MIDTHAHLDAFGDESLAVVARARAAGVTRMISVGTDVESCRTTLELAEGEDGVFAALGIHPHEAEQVGEPELAALEALLDHPKAVAVGETGLDYYRDYAPRERQLDVFEAQCAIAARAGKALVIHTRAADDDTLTVLTRLPREARVILHCFSSPAMLAPALERGWYVSFAGNVTYPNAVELRGAAARVPADRLLVETDSPYLAPQTVRGRRNEPANVVHTARALAEVRRVDPEELAATLERNAAEAFGLP